MAAYTDATRSWFHRDEAVVVSNRPAVATCQVGAQTRKPMITKASVAKIAANSDEGSLARA